MDETNTAKIAYHALCTMVGYDTPAPFETLSEAKLGALCGAVQKIGEAYVKVWIDDLERRHPRNVRNIKIRERNAILGVCNPTDGNSYPMHDLLPDSTDWEQVEGVKSLTMACAALTSVSSFNDVSIACGPIDGPEDGVPTMIVVLRGAKHCELGKKMVLEAGAHYSVNLVEVEMKSDVQN